MNNQKEGQETRVFQVKSINQRNALLCRGAVLRREKLQQ